MTLEEEEEEEGDEAEEGDAGAAEIVALELTGSTAAAAAAAAKPKSNSHSRKTKTAAKSKSNSHSGKTTSNDGTVEKLETTIVGKITSAIDMAKNAVPQLHTCYVPLQISKMISKILTRYWSRVHGTCLLLWKSFIPYQKQCWKR